LHLKQGTLYLSDEDASVLEIKEFKAELVEIIVRRVRTPLVSHGHTRSDVSATDTAPVSYKSNTSLTYVT